MKFEAGETVLLGATHYRILGHLATGAVADVYRATPVEFPDTEVIIKLVRDDAGPDPLRIEGIQHEAEVLTILNRAEDPRWPRSAGFAARLRRAQETTLQRRVVALLDSGEAAPQHPYLIQEKAPPPFERFPVESLADERRMLAVAQAVAGVIALAHRHNLALKDFEPHTKWDRICLRWLDDGERFEVKIIDWDVTGGTEDMAQDLFFFGRHLYYFLLGHHLTLGEQEQPPANLGLGTPGWERLTQGSRQILQHLLHRDPRRRYQRAEAVEADLAWWVEVLRQTDAPNALDRLQERIWQARPQGRHDRVLAVADLALRLNPPVEMRGAFELWARQAREELEKGIWQPIAHARATLLTGAYEKAAGEFAQQLQALPPESEAARLARLYQRLAQAGALLKGVHQGADVRPTPEWEALNRAVGALVKRQWDEAQSAVLEAARLQPQAAAWQPVNDLLDWSRAGLLLQEANALIARAEPRRADADRADWVKIEADRIALLEQALRKLEEAKNLASLEPDFAERWRAEQAHLQRRRDFLTRYENVDTLTAQGEETLRRGRQAEVSADLASAAEYYHRAGEAFRSALDELQAILDADPTQYRARILRERLQPRLREAEERQRETSQRAEAASQAGEALKRAREFLRQGAYGQALPHARQAAMLIEREEAQEVLAEAEAGDRLERRAVGYLETARQYLEMRNLDEAKRLAKQPRSWNGRPLKQLPDGEGLPELVGDKPFRLRTDLSDAITALLDLVNYIEEVHRRIREARLRGEHSTVITALEELAGRLKEQGHTLTDEERDWLEEAHQRLDALNRAKDILSGEPSFDLLRTVVGDLAGDPGDRARELRKRAGEAWLRLVESANLHLDAIHDLLQEGAELFEGLPIAKSISEMQRWVEQGLTIARDLTAVGGPWPTWFESDLGPYLLRLTDDLDHLIDQEAWPLLRGRHEGWWVLQKRVENWRGQLTDYLTKYLWPQLEAARERSRQRRFQEALETAQRDWVIIPESLRNGLPPDIGREGLARLIADLRARQQAEEDLHRLARQLASGELSFIEAHREADKLYLPDHPDIPVDDLTRFISDLERAAESERALYEEPRVETYASLIHRRRNLAREALPALRGETAPVVPFIPAFMLNDVDLRQGLNRRLATLQQSLRQAIFQVGGQLCQALEDRCRALSEQPEPDPKPLLLLYWQTLWWQAVAALEERQERENIRRALGTARGVAGKLLRRAADIFIRMEHRGDLERAHDLLIGLRNLNSGLARLPTEADGLDLPPLPQGAQYDRLTPPVDSDALDGFGKEVEYFLELTARAEEGGTPVGHPEEIATPLKPTWEEMMAQLEAGEQPPEVEVEAESGGKPSVKTYNPDEVAEVRVLAHQIKEHLTRLRRRIWPALSLEPWPDDAGPASLEREAELHAALATALNEAHRHLYEDRDAIAGLSTLYSEIENKGRIRELDGFTLWLLTPRRAILKAAFDALRRDLIGALGAQVAGILEDQATAAERFQEEIFDKVPPDAGWIADAVYEAVLDGVSRRADEAVAAGRRDEARALWKTVIKATERWAAPRSGRRVSRSLSRLWRSRPRQSAKTGREGTAERARPPRRRSKTPPPKPRRRNP